MESSGKDEKSGSEGRIDPQFQMFDESPREDDVGSIAHQGERWAVVLQTRECADRLFRGRILFRSQGRELRSADLFIEGSYEEVLERAQNFERHLLSDLIRSLS